MKKGYKHSEDVKRKISESRKGKHHNEETKRKIKLGNKGKNLGKKLSEETKQKISKNLKGKNLGKKFSEEHKLKLSISHKGKPSSRKGIKLSKEIKLKISNSLKVHIPWNKGIAMTEQAKEKMSKSLKGRKSPCGMLNKKHSKKTKQKMSKAHKGKHHSEETKRKLSLMFKGRKITEKTKNKIKEAFKNQSVYIKKQMIQKIKEVRLKQKNTWESSIEKKIQYFLTELKVPFIKHKVIGDIEHRYQCDIYIPDLNMIIECDGDYWHDYPNGNEIDKIRNKELKEKNYKLLRLWERDIKNMNIIQFKNILCDSYYKQIKVDNI